MLSRCINVTIASLLLLGVMLAGCAKRPATTAAAAPAPTGAAATTPGGAGPAMAQPTTAAPSGGGAGAGQPAPAPATAAPTPRPEPKDFRAIPELNDVFFDFDKYDIRPADAKVLDSNATWLKSNANHLVLIEGHCDERGTNEYNLALGERRATAAKNVLVALGVPANRVNTISYGKERPAVVGSNESAWAQNRRDVTVVN
jgi:peptidoglycan-associated lipoprotein